MLEILLPVAAVSMTMAYHDQEGAMEFLKVFIATEGSTWALKKCITSTRPNGKKHSFPSGHTSIAFAASGFIQQRYGWRYGFPAHVAATLVGCSRLKAKAHRAVDVIAGASLGLFFNFLFTSPYMPSNCQVFASSSPIGSHIVFNYQF